MIVEFFRELVRSRVKLVESRARGKVVGAQARVKSKVAGKFNDAVEKPMAAATNAIDKKSRAAKAKMKGGGGAKAGGAKPGGGKAGGASKAESPKALPAGGGGGGARSPAAGGGSAPAKREKVDKGTKGDRRGFMGLFRSKSKDGGRSAAGSGESFGDDGATQVIDVSSFQDDRSFDVVGWVVPLNGVDRGRDFRLHTGKNIIGTAADCDIVVTDPYMSAKHAAVIHQNGIFTLIDLGSTNGTCLNDRPVQKEELIDNDTVRVGRTELKFKSLF